MKTILLTLLFFALFSLSAMGQNKVKPIQDSSPPNVDTPQRKVKIPEVIVKPKKDTGGRTGGKKPVVGKVEKKSGTGKTEKKKSFWDSGWFKLMLVGLGFGLRILYQLTIIEHRDKKRKKRYLISVIEGYDSIIENQLGMFTPFLEALNKKDMNDGVFRTVIGLTKNNVDAVTRSDAFNIFVKNKKNDKKSEAFHKLYNNIDWVDALYLETLDKFKDSFEKMTKYEEEWYKNIDKVREFHDKYLDKVRSKEITEPFMLDFFLEIFPDYVDRFVDGVAPDIFATKKYLLEPLLTLCKSEQSEQSEYVGELLTILLWADLAFLNYEKNIRVTIQKFESLEKRFKAGQAKIETNLQILKN